MARAKAKVEPDQHRVLVLRATGISDWEYRRLSGMTKSDLVEYIARLGQEKGRATKDHAETAKRFGEAAEKLELYEKIDRALAAIAAARLRRDKVSLALSKENFEQYPLFRGRPALEVAIAKRHKGEIGRNGEPAAIERELCRTYPQALAAELAKIAEAVAEFDVVEEERREIELERAGAGVERERMIRALEAKGVDWDRDGWKF